MRRNSTISKLPEEQVAAEEDKLFDGAARSDRVGKLIHHFLFVDPSPLYHHLVDGVPN
jgi:hypothetical protein